MTGTATPHGTTAPRRADAHALLVAESEQDRRARAASWVNRQLAGGAKVYYKGWFDETADPSTHWILGSDGARLAAGALRTGQLELLGFAGVVERCGGTTDGLRRLLRGEVEQALDQGWSRVAMSQESTRRPMADDDEAAEFAAQEATYDELALRWPLTTLCQLTLPEENRAATWESAAVHHHRILDPQWSASSDERGWWLSGVLDAQVSECFGAALYGALLEARRRSSPDLHVDLSGVEFIDLAFVQTLYLTARTAAAHQNVVIHGADGFARRVLDAVGRPSSVQYADRARR